MTTTQSPPLWRPLAALTALVTAAHVLVLQASPDNLGLKLTPDTAGNKAFATRRIEAPPEAVVGAARPEKPAVAAQTLQKAVAKPKIQPNQPLAQDNRLSPAIDSIAEPVTTAVAESPVASVSADVSATLAPPAANPASQPVSTVAAASTATTARAELPNPTLVTAVNLPASARLQYKMTGTSRGLTYYANAELNWSNSGSQYEAAMKVSAMFVGARSMSSVGRITPSGLAPTRFADKSRSELAVHFDADKGKITFSANTPDAPWMEGAQDRVSVFMQLAGMLAASPTAASGPGGPPGLGGFPAGSSITVYTLGPREADTWTFVVEAEERLQLPYGELDTLKLSRKPRREYDQKVEIWYAPSLGYLPVRNRITQQNGDFIDQVLSDLGKP